MFESTFGRNEFLIDDTNFLQHAPPSDVLIDGELKTRGYIPRDYTLHPQGSLGFMSSFDLEIPPRDVWDEIIEKMERTKSRLSDIATQAELDCLDQNGTNYCWINAPTYCIMMARAEMGLPTVKLSPASVGCKIKGFRNVGGWGMEGLQYIIEHGIVPQELWPPNAQDQKYDTTAAWDRAADFKVQKWYELENRNFDQMFACLFKRMPVPIGLNWWSHEVSAIDPVIIPASIRNQRDKLIKNAAPEHIYAMCSGSDMMLRSMHADKIRGILRARNASKYGTRIRNSWGMTYGDRGYAVLSESKSTPDDACCPVSVVDSK